MKVMVTGAGGLIGSEASLHWLDKGCDVVGVDNNSRARFFGPKGDVSSTLAMLARNPRFLPVKCDIRNRDTITGWIGHEKPDVIVHCAAQPSHDKAASIPFDDFDTNAVGTMNMLEGFRQMVNRAGKSEAVFIHVSTNKVYGDRPNELPLIEGETRYLIAPGTRYSSGIDETMSIDTSTHSLFGASKLAADVMAQEYGRYFGLNVGVFRGGCLTGSRHASVELHGFLSYIVKCAVKRDPYMIFGYKGKQVRDQIHSADVISCFERFIESPRPGEVYNLGGGAENSASVLEVIDLIREISGEELSFQVSDKNRVGDHICYYTDMSKFRTHYPGWSVSRDLKSIIEEMVEELR
jgi:CDP-paratose 2-epimerase